VKKDEEIDVVCRRGKGLFCIYTVDAEKGEVGNVVSFFHVVDGGEKRKREKKRESGETHPKLGINDTYWIGKKHSPRAGKSRKKTEKGRVKR